MAGSETPPKRLWKIRRDDDDPHRQPIRARMYRDSYDGTPIARPVTLHVGCELIVNLRTIVNRLSLGTGNKCHSRYALLLKPLDSQGTGLRPVDCFATRASGV